MLTTRNQSQVSISGLTYNNLLQDTYNALRDSDAFSKNFTDFTSNSAERMITELYAYVATQLANRLDQIGNELFVDTASASGMSRLLKLVGARVDFPSAANTFVNVTTSSNANTIPFSIGIDRGDELAFTSSSFKSINASNGTKWEFIDYAIGNNGTYVYDYTAPYSFTAPSQEYQVYEGTTRSFEYTVRSINTDIITLPASPVIKDSVRVYYKKKQNKANSDAYEIVEFKKVDNFFTTEALTAEVGVFTERNLGNGVCEITLKPYYDAESNKSDIGKELLIMYRTGGGAVGNISVGLIDKSERFVITDDNNKSIGYGLLNIYNTTAGAGGKDELTTDEIRATVLKEVRNTKIAVTEEDYEYLFPKYDSEIQLIKCYGEKQDEIADLSSTYGYYVNPLNVWLIILKYNKQFYDAYMKDTTGLTDRINDIAFSTLDINPRFNEVYQINKAFINQIYESVQIPQNLTIDPDSETFAYSFEIDKEGAELLANGNCNITVTTHPYIESSNSNRRGVNCFRRYDKEIEAEDVITWEELLAKTSGTKGDVYIITDKDGSGSSEINNRWICLQDFENVTVTPDNYSDYWEKVEFSYVYNNLTTDNVSEDIMYIQQGNDLGFIPVYSILDHSFSCDWETLLEDDDWSDQGHVVFPVTSFININGQIIQVLQGSVFNTPQDFCDFINNMMLPTTNAIFLKRNIASNMVSDPRNVSISSSSEYVSSNDFTLVLKQNNETIPKNVTVSTSGISTYGDLVDAINNAISNASLSSKYRAVIINADECFNIAIISSNEFTYEDLSTDISNNSSLYVYLLDNAIPEWPLYSNVVELTSSQAEEWANYLSSSSEIAWVEDGLIYLGYGDDGKTTIQISANDIKIQTLRAAFNISSTAPTTMKNRREITVNFNQSAVTASLIINIAGENDLIKGPIYINIFGARNNSIRLGSFYENIEENLKDVPDVVLKLLKREPIKNLYSTTYTNEGISLAIDKYGSDYQLKFSSGLVEEQTYNQLSSNLYPAYVVTIKSSNDSMTYYSPETYLYLKVDNIDYDGTEEITTGSGITYTVPQVNGYARFDLNWFNSSNITHFVNAIIKTFQNLGPAGEEGGDPTPLLKKELVEGDAIKISTLSSAYYSSIDFGSTTPAIIYNLFGSDNMIIYSKEGQIDATQIKYKMFAFTENVAIGQAMRITVVRPGGETISDTISIGYSLIDFINNLTKSEVGKFVRIDNNRIVFDELTNEASITIDLNWQYKFQFENWKNMFSRDTWEKFTITQEEGQESGSATCTQSNDGDYYIDLVVNEDGENEYYFVVQREETFPLGDIYFHMYEDYSYDHVVKETENDLVYTDEYKWNNLMTDKKVMLTEHVYKQPRFLSFDLALTCYLPNTETFSQTDYYTEISNYLRDIYGIYANNIGLEILPDDIILNIKERFSKVLKVTIDYLGYEISNEKTNKEFLPTSFNQMHILSNTETTNKLVEDPKTGFIKSEEVMKHGLDLKIRYRSN